MVYLVQYIWYIWYRLSSTDLKYMVYLVQYISIFHICQAITRPPFSWNLPNPFGISGLLHVGQDSRGLSPFVGEGRQTHIVRSVAIAPGRNHTSCRQATSIGFSANQSHSRHRARNVLLHLQYDIMLWYKRRRDPELWALALGSRF